MPAPALHHLLAGRVYARWQAAPVHAPFEPSPAARNAMLHGALGPDMGYFPGADPLLAELAHHARTGAFCRALVHGARTDLERAFAWGWVTHVLADMAIHPLINDACGELLRGHRTPLWGPAVAIEHLRVETGLDAAVHARHPGLETALPALHPAVFHGLRQAYLRTFGAAPEPEALLRAHRRVALLMRPSAGLRAVAARAVGGGGASGRFARTVLRAAALLSARGSHARGLLSPVPPTAWLVAEVDEVVEGFADWFDGHYMSGLQFLRDHCLDTGEPQERDQPCACRAIAALHARRRPGRGARRRLTSIPGQECARRGARSYAAPITSSAESRSSTNTTRRAGDGRAASCRAPRRLCHPAGFQQQLRAGLHLRASHGGHPVGGGEPPEVVLQVRGAAVPPAREPARPELRARLVQRIHRP